MPPKKFAKKHRLNIVRVNGKSYLRVTLDKTIDTFIEGLLR